MRERSQMKRLQSLLVAFYDARHRNPSTPAELIAFAQEKHIQLDFRNFRGLTIRHPRDIENWELSFYFDGTAPRPVTIGCMYAAEDHTCGGSAISSK
jgi:hypothetical protein